MKLIERATQNDLNCQAGALQLLYSLSELSILKEPFASYAVGLTVDATDQEKWQTIVLDLATSLLAFQEDMHDTGQIVGSIK